jgi:hypothetical protein
MFVRTIATVWRLQVLQLSTLPLNTNLYKRTSIRGLKWNASVSVQLTRSDMEPKVSRTLLKMCLRPTCGQGESPQTVSDDLIPFVEDRLVRIIEGKTR